MKRGKLILILLTIALIIAGLGWIGYFKFYKTKVVSPVGNTQPTPIPFEELAAWTDQSEFSFQYPISLMLNPHGEDQENYAHVELTSATYSGSLTVWAKDTTARDLDEWVKQNKIAGALDSTLGGEPAKKVLTDSEPKKLTTSVVRNGYLYQIEANLNYWNKVYDTVSSTFKFIPSEKNDGGKNSTQTESYDDSGVAGGEEFSDEEVIE